MHQAENRKLVQVLIEEPSPKKRSRVHCELARRAVESDDLAKAMCHYREAAVLDPSDDGAREALEALREQVSGGRRKRGVLRRLVGRMARSG